MIIEIDNLTARVVQATQAETAWLHEFLSFEDNASQFVRRRDGSVKRVEPRRASLLALNDTFPAGLTSAVRKNAIKDNFLVNVIDKRTPPCAVLTWQQATGTNDPWLHDFQREAVEQALTRTRGILDIPTGGGKCLAPETLVLHFDGRVTRADEVKVGDTLMGELSEPRKVLSTCAGVGPRYRIIPNKGDAWECNDVHVLTLINTSTNKVIDIPLDEYLTKSKTFKHEHKLFCVAAHFPPQAALPVDPYFIGLWIGDGRKSLSAVEVTKADPEIFHALTQVAETWGCEVKTDFSRGVTSQAHRLVTPRGRPNALLEKMRELLGNDRVDSSLRTASFDERMQMLAGVCDTDGYLGSGFFEVAQKPGERSQFIAFLARSLGFRVTHRTKIVRGEPYDRWGILGEVDMIPTRTPRKKAPKRQIRKDAARVGFRVEKVSDAAPYAGFTLDGNGRFLLADFTVTHNTEVAVGIALRLGMTNTLFIAPETDLMHNAARRWEKRVPSVPAGRIGDGIFEPRDGFTSATFQTLASKLAKNDRATREYLQRVGCMIVDEVHTLPADTFYNVAQAVPAYWRIGVSGTPLARGDRRSLFSIAATGSIIYKVPTQLLIERGFISRPHIRMVPHVQAGEAASWQTAEKVNIINSKSRNQLVTQLAINAPGPTLVFVRMKQHGQTLTEMIRATGKRVEFVWGEKATHQRDAAIEKLRNGDLDIIVCSVVFQTGTDIPEVKSMVIACGGKSEIATLQRIGRGMRIVRAPDGTTIKDAFYVFDVFDREPPSQSGDTANRWAAKHSQERFKAYTAVGHEVTIAT